MAQPPAAASAHPYPAPAPAGRRPRPGRWIALAVLLVLLAAVGGYVLGRGTAGSAGSTGRALGVPYGPTRMTDGVPGGYTRDRGGAATAAINAVQAALFVQANKLSAKAVVTQLAAPSIDPASKAALATLDKGSLTNPGTSLAFPLLVQTDRVTDTDARETVYFTEIDYGQGTQGSQSGLVQYFFAAVHLAWSHGDWKVAMLSTRYTAPGPGGLSAIKEPGTQRLVPWHGTQFIFLAGG